MTSVSYCVVLGERWGWGEHLNGLKILNTIPWYSFLSHIHVPEGVLVNCDALGYCSRGSEVPRAQHVAVAMAGDESHELQCLHLDHYPGNCPVNIMKGACYSCLATSSRTLCGQTFGSLRLFTGSEEIRIT